ncbi:MAG: excinuclease ABC subunit UvrB [Actinobacteria bacterium]|nr:excinuclease ABC subunit UvrB [Actinomycetota bacterium]
MMNKFKVISDFIPQGDQPDAIQNLKKGILNNFDYQTLMGITGSGKSATIAWLIEELQMPALVLAPNKALAAQLANEFKQFFPENRVEYFVSYYDYYQPEAYVPRTDTFIEKDSNINEEIDRLRHSATSALLLRKDVIVVSSVSCIYGLGSPQEYKNKIIPLIKGTEFELDKLLEELIKQQYVRNDLVVTRGTFRLKGDTLDIFPVYEETIFRIEYFGDEIENITRIDPITGEILEKLTELAILPASHYVTSEDVMNNALSQIEKDMNKQIKKFEKEDKLLEAQRIKQRTMFDLEMLRELGVCSGIENYSRYFDGRSPGDPPYTLLDFFQEEFLMVVDESHIAIPQIRGQFAGDKSRKTTLVDYGFRLPAALDNRPLKFEEWQGKVKNTVLVSATPGKWENSNSQNFVEQIIRPTGLLDPNIIIRPTQNQIEDLLKEIKQVISKGNRVLVTTLTKKMSEALSDYFLKMGIKTRYLHSDIDTLERIEILRDLRKGEFDVLVGINLLREGLDLPEVELVAIMDADKEGFLRSETSLIQTIGRAARNKDGYVIMYADRKTDSITKSVYETNRRREIQMAHNEKFDITPTTISKEITDILEMVEKNRPSKDEMKFMSNINLKNASKQDLYKISKNIEKEMKVAADLLEFELAARLRDELKEIKKEIMELPS